MSVLDNALQALLLNGCKVKKLWTNAASGSDFPAQKISLSMAKYDAALIELKTSKSDAASEYCRICFKGKDDWADAFANAQRDAVVEIRTRQYSVSSTGVNFQSGYGKSVSSMSSSVRNDYAIPSTIYGIQLLGGVIHKLKTLAASLFLRREVLA